MRNTHGVRILLSAKVRSDTYMKEKTFYAAMYLRLSRDDIPAGDGGRPASAKAESESIANQRELVKSYIREQPDIELCDIYAEM